MDSIEAARNWRDKNKQKRGPKTLHHDEAASAEADSTRAFSENPVRAENEYGAFKVQPSSVLPFAPIVVDSNEESLSIIVERIVKRNAQ